MLLLFQKLKGVIKTKSTGDGVGMPNPVAMGKALIARNFTPAAKLGNSSSGGGGQLPSNSDTIADIFSGKEGSQLVPNKHRAFLMDTQVKYTIVSDLFY
jgi:hypothetical protein